MTKFTNTQRDAAINAIKAAASADRANNRLETSALALVDAGISAKDISKDGAHLAEFQSITAETILSAKAFATWADTSLAQGKMVNGKRVDSARGKLVKQVNSFVARVRAKMQEPAKRGAQGPARTLDQMIVDQCDKWMKRIAKDKDNEKFQFGDADPVAAFTALKAVVAAISGK